MEWGLTHRGNRRHVLAEDSPGVETPLVCCGITPSAPCCFEGISLCGALLVDRVINPENMRYWPVCHNCQTLLSAMESV